MIKLYRLQVMSYHIGGAAKTVLAIRAKFESGNNGEMQNYQKNHDRALIDVSATDSSKNW